MTVVTAYDLIRVNLPHAPAGAQLAGYITGSSSVAWAGSDWQAHPHAVRIDQSPVLDALDETADVLDYENGAATLADIAPYSKAAAKNYNAGIRPGQRSPLIYASKASLTSVCNALADGGTHSGTGLWVADWDITRAEAQAMIEQAAGPYPVRGVQLASGPYYDTDLFDAAWLASGGPRLSASYAQVPGAPGTAPANIVVSPDPQTTVSWTQVGGATGYRVQLEHANASGTTVAVSQTHAVYDNLPAGPWTARVCAVNAKGSGPWSPWKGFRVT